MSETQQQEQNKVIGIYARVKVCEVNLENQDVKFEEGVNPKFAVQALLQEVQLLQNQNKELADKLPKTEDTKDL